jgi:hypothetical protein
VSGHAQNTVSQPATAIPSRHRVHAELAFATALSYRFAVFYLPPIWGYVCFKWLAARHYL